jgi:thiamine-monophosphate kinase
MKSDAHDAPNISMGSGREFDSIRALLDVWGDLAAGIGDDAAILDSTSTEPLVVSTDACIEGVHFERSWIDARDVGVRAAAAALSDIAAMGARAESVLLAFIVPANWQGALAQVARGIGDVVRASGARIVGGNMSAGAHFSVTTTVIGRASAPVHRTGARPGDVLVVTGVLGGPAQAVQALRAGNTPGAWAFERFRAPRPRLAEAAWLAEAGAHAMIDISDGLLADAGHLVRASVVDALLDASLIPCGPDINREQALGSGEEYELLVALPSSSADDVCSRYERRFGTTITVIGDITHALRQGAVTVRNATAEKTANRVEIPAGHDHFSA